MLPDSLPSTDDIALVGETINSVLVDNGHKPMDLRPDTNILHETPLDSMGLAIVVLQLEEVTGKDPFAEGFILFQTVGELAALYER